MVAAEDARFLYSEVRIGFVAALVATFLPLRLRGADIRELLLFPRFVDARQALEIGLINRVVPPQPTSPAVGEALAAEVLDDRQLGVDRPHQAAAARRSSAGPLDDALDRAAEVNAAGPRDRRTAGAASPPSSKPRSRRAGGSSSVAAASPGRSSAGCACCSSTSTARWSIAARQPRALFAAALVEVFGTAGDVDGYNFAGRTDPQIVLDLMTGAGVPAEEVRAAPAADARPLPAAARTRPRPRPHAPAARGGGDARAAGARDRTSSSPC